MAQKALNLALQGGGSHGAYTWGVLDRLLEEKDIDIHGASGTSAGAMNAVVLADGYRKGGRDAAKEKLHDFWQRISQATAFINPSSHSEIARIAEGWNIDKALGYLWFDTLTRMFSPYQFNPFNINPLRSLLRDFIDWERINNGGEIPLFITATSVTTGRPRVFHCREVTEDVLLASACVPFLFQSVEIDDEPYWDGGYMGNPSIWPLIYNTDIKDVLLVQINPLVRSGTPRTGQEIINRMNEITFNSSLIAEMRAINFVGGLVESKKLDDPRYKQMHIHMIGAPDASHGLNGSSKVNVSWCFLQFLHGIGREKADAWIATHKTDIGRKGSLDIAEVFLGMPKPKRSTADDLNKKNDRAIVPAARLRR
jgi:NTE family protein